MQYLLLMCSFEIASSVKQRFNNTGNDALGFFLKIGHICLDNGSQFELIITLVMEKVWPEVLFNKILNGNYIL